MKFKRARSNRFSVEAAFTLVEILCVIAILAILAAILFPMFAKAKAKAREATCIVQLRQIGASLRMYREDNRELPFRLSMIYPTYTKNSAQILVCPNDPTKGLHLDSPLNEGDGFLASGVSYDYLPRWLSFAPEPQELKLGWWKPAPHYGEGQWQDLTPLVTCNWHWANKILFNVKYNEPQKGVGLRLIMGLDTGVRRVPTTLKWQEFTPEKYQ